MTALSSTLAAATGSGGIVGLVLGLFGGGGSILAVPLLVYVVGIASPHVAIGTSAVAVALSALQVNIRGARLPEPEDDGRRHLKIPLDALEGAAW